MSKWECRSCGDVYNPEDGDPEIGIEPGTPFENLPDDWTCPECVVSKNAFKELE